MKLCFAFQFRVLRFWRRLGPLLMLSVYLLGQGTYAGPAVGRLGVIDPASRWAADLAAICTARPTGAIKEIGSRKTGHQDGDPACLLCPDCLLAGLQTFSPPQMPALDAPRFIGSAGLVLADAFVPPPHHSPRPPSQGPPTPF